MTIRIAVAQIDLMVGDIEGNANKIIDTARRARDTLGAELVLFPELALTGYPPEDLLLRPRCATRVSAALERICAAVDDVGLVFGFPWEDAGRRYNAAGLVRGGRVEAVYRKAELPNYSVFDEKRYFLPGHQPLVFEHGGVRFGITICEDVWVEGPVQAAAEAGARVVLNLNASPFHREKAHERWQQVAARVRANQVGLVYANTVGGQDELVFDGASFAVDARGVQTHAARQFVEELMLVEVDGDGNVLPGERHAPASEDWQVYNALVCGVRDYVSKNGFQGAVLGLSGGIDSALTLAVAVDALGATNVEVVLMPSRYTADISNQDAVRQAQLAGVKHASIPIEPAFNAFLEMLSAEFAGQPADVTEENIQARCRGIVLMAISNKSGRMLLTTGNKSEMSVGYATLYGDMAGGFAPLKDVSKLWVYRLARWRNRGGEVIPQRVIERPPSAELRPDQKDSDSLPDYAVLDAILERYVEQDQARDEIVAAGFDAATVERVIRLVDNSEYKRRQAPPGVKITRRAYGRDRRYPIASRF